MGELIEGEVCALESSREGYAGEVPAALGGDRSDSGARSSPTPEGGHALSPHEPLPGRWEDLCTAMAEGRDAPEAARMAGMSARKALSLLKREETAQRVVFLVRQKVRMESGRAQGVISSLLEANSERVRLDAALAILDRSGVCEGTPQASPVTVVIDLSGR